MWCSPGPKPRKRGGAVASIAVAAALSPDFYGYLTRSGSNPPDIWYDAILAHFDKCFPGQSLVGRRLIAVHGPESSFTLSNHTFIHLSIDLDASKKRSCAATVYHSTRELEKQCPCLPTEECCQIHSATTLSLKTTTRCWLALCRQFKMCPSPEGLYCVVHRSPSRAKRELTSSPKPALSPESSHTGLWPYAQSKPTTMFIHIKAMSCFA